LNLFTKTTFYKKHRPLNNRKSATE
jgi:hypothetical protein